MSSYVERSCGDGERIVAKAHFHWLYTFRSLLALIIPFAVLIAILLFWREYAGGSLVIAGLILMLAGIIIFVRRVVRRSTTEIAVTSHRFVEKSGLIALRTNEIALTNIEGVRVYQGFWGRIWGYGSLTIEGTGIDRVNLPVIADPVGFRRAIETAKGIK